jgi:hypothetical protein
MAAFRAAFQAAIPAVFAAMPPASFAAFMPLWVPRGVRAGVKGVSARMAHPLQRSARD